MKDRYIREGTEIIMGEYIMPKDNWTSLFNHQRRQRAERLLVQTKHEAEEEEEETRPSSSISDVQNCQQSFNYLAPMSNEHDIAELTWENGQLAFHGFNGLFPSSCPTKPLQTWERTGDTLESVVQLATTGSRRLANSITNPAVENTSKNNNSHEDLIIPNVVGSVVASSGGLNCCNQTQSSSGQVQLSVGNDQINCCVGRKGSFFSFSGEELQDQRACASASAAFCGENNNRSDNDTTVITGASLDSSKMVTDEDSASDHALLGKEQKTKAETVSGRTSATRRRRAAAIHNQSERKRRDRINQKMKALQKLVPRASKTDKASMLDEVIEYLKQLQAQVQMMASTRTMSQLMMPLGMQQQLQMSILAQMGAEVDPRSGMGIGMLDMGKVNAATSSMPQHLSPGIHTFPFAPPSFLVPSMLPLQQPNQDPRNSASSGMQNPYHAFLAQSIDMEMYNRMAAVYRQQMHQAMGAITGDQHLQSNSMHQGSTLR